MILSTVLIDSHHLSRPFQQTTSSIILINSLSDSPTDLLTSSADSAMKKPCVFESMTTLGPGLMAMLLSVPLPPLVSIASSNSFNFTKHVLRQEGQKAVLIRDAGAFYAYNLKDGAFNRSFTAYLLIYCRSTVAIIVIVKFLLPIQTRPVANRSR